MACHRNLIFVPNQEALGLFGTLKVTVNGQDLVRPRETAIIAQSRFQRHI